MGTCIENTELKSHDALMVLLFHIPSTHKQQVLRLMARDGLSEEQALKRIGAQIPLSSKCQWADVVIDNSGDRHTTRQQVEQLVQDMNKLSSHRRFLYLAIIITGLIVALAVITSVFM